MERSGPCENMGVGKLREESCQDFCRRYVKGADLSLVTFQSGGRCKI